MKKSIDYARKIKFIDENDTRVLVEIEIREGCLTMSGRYGTDSFGQIDFEPANRAQEELKYIWKHYHLNDLHAGTELQQILVEGDQPYINKVKRLRSIKIKDCDIEARGEMPMHPKITTQPDEEDWMYIDTALFDEVIIDEEPYLWLYGAGWLKRPLDDSFIDYLDKVCEEVLAGERSSDKKFDPDNELHMEALREAFDYPEHVAAVAVNIGVSLATAIEADVEGGAGCQVTINGCSFLVGTDDEADKLAVAMVEDYVDDVAFIDVPVHLRKYFDMQEYIEDVIKHDGRGSLLDHWDGTEYTEEINETTYYIYSQ